MYIKNKKKTKKVFENIKNADKSYDNLLTCGKDKSKIIPWSFCCIVLRQVG